MDQKVKYLAILLKYFKSYNPHCNCIHVQRQLHAISSFVFLPSISSNVLQIPLLSGIQSQHDTQVVGVQFQEDTDNSKNFPDVKAFHAFKKQRCIQVSVMILLIRYIAP